MSGVFWVSLIPSAIFGGVAGVLSALLLLEKEKNRWGK